MYKKLHKAEIVTSSKPLGDKGSFFACLPERDIMLTSFVYHIQPKKKKTTGFISSFVSISSRNHQYRIHPVGSNDEPICILEPNDNEEDEDGDKAVDGIAVDGIEAVVVCKKNHIGKNVVNR
ncbi:hypothetical protein [Bacillus weihaiensis]|uniref:hypothetical protein n=1 Tax=Bacillus weihaiensis TaxID=1547283 RepID=UPI00235686DD|nr:hypothetical protein [Bacillus weihaiensis]